MIQRMLAIWSAVPLPILNPAWTFGKFSVHRLLKSSLENFEHYFASVWDECNCVLVWTFFSIGMKTDLFQSCGHCWVFQISWHIECNTFTASSFRIWNSSTGIPSLPVALFVVMLSKDHLTSYSRMSGVNSKFTSWNTSSILYLLKLFQSHNPNLWSTLFRSP